MKLSEFRLHFLYAIKRARHEFHHKRGIGLHYRSEAYAEALTVGDVALVDHGGQAVAAYEAVEVHVGEVVESTLAVVHGEGVEEVASALTAGECDGVGAH